MANIRIQDASDSSRHVILPNAEVRPASEEIGDGSMAEAPAKALSSVFNMVGDYYDQQWQKSQAAARQIAVSSEGVAANEFSRNTLQSLKNDPTTTPDNIIPQYQKAMRGYYTQAQARYADNTDPSVWADVSGQINRMHMVGEDDAFNFAQKKAKDQGLATLQDNYNKMLDSIPTGNTQSDEAGRNVLYGQADQALDAGVKADYMSQEQADAFKRKMRADGTSAVASSLIASGDVAGARGFIADHSDMLDPDHKVMLDDRAMMMGDRLQAKSIAQQQAQEHHDEVMSAMMVSDPGKWAADPRGGGVNTQNPQDIYVATGGATVFPGKVATKAASQLFSSANDPSQMQQLTQSFNQKYGDLAPQAYAEMEKEGGLSHSLAIIGTKLTQPTDLPIVDAAMTAYKDTAAVDQRWKDANVGAPVEDATIRNNISQSLSKYTSSGAFVTDPSNRENNLKDTLDMGVLTVKQLVNTGQAKDMETAVKMYSGALQDKAFYATPSGQQNPIYVPNTNGADISQRVVTGLDSLKAGYKDDGVTFAPNYQSQEVVKAQAGYQLKNSFWDITRDQTGYQLLTQYNGRVFPVIDKSTSKPIVKTIGDAMDAAKDTSAPEAPAWGGF